MESREESTPASSNLHSKCSEEPTESAYSVKPTEVNTGKRNSPPVCPDPAGSGIVPAG